MMESQLKIITRQDASVEVVCNKHHDEQAPIDVQQTSASKLKGVQQTFRSASTDERK